MDAEQIRLSEEAGSDYEPFIVTATKNKFHFNEAGTDEIRIFDIAVSLSHLCRFTGHLRGFFSVAQHSLLVAEKMPGTPEDKLAALLHDAAEAYCGDLSSPCKSYLKTLGTSSYSDLLNDITSDIYIRFGVEEVPKQLRNYDLASCLFEAQAFMGLSIDEAKEKGLPVQFEGLWQPWDPETYFLDHANAHFTYVQNEFLSRFESLMIQSGRKALL